MLALTSCATTNVRSLSEQYAVLKGTLQAPPEFEAGNRRLILYLKVENQEETDIVIAVAENRENKDVLVNLNQKIKNAPSDPIFLYGIDMKNQSWNEYVDGIDFLIVAVGVYIPPAEAYQIILTDYGERGKDALRNISWSRFVRAMGKLAIKQIY